MNKIFSNFCVLGLILAVLLVGSAPALAQTGLTAGINSPASGATLTVGVPFAFSGSASGGDSSFYAYVWSFGDGTFGAGPNYNKTYTVSGPKTVELTVTDGSGNHASFSRNINVVSAPTSGLPVINFLANGSAGSITIATTTAVTLSWTTTDATTCTASGAWSGSKPLTGSEVVTVSSTSTFTLSCTGPGGTSNASVTVNLGGSGPVAPVISNIQVSNITQTTATITWDTNIPADSRVIYDTVSHPTLGTAPNYGYANSTGITDTSPKVTSHSVQLTGLSPSTQYFFRVLSQS